MRKRQPNLFVQDIMESMEKIESYTKGLTLETFTEKNIAVDAVLRNLEVIGEASKNIPSAVREKYPKIPWKKMVGLRNITIHEYFGVDNSIIWEIATKDLPETKKEIKKMLSDLEKAK